MYARQALIRQPNFLMARCCVRLLDTELRECPGRPVSTARSSQRRRSPQVTVTRSATPLITDIWRTGSGQTKRFGEPLAVTAARFLQRPTQATPPAPSYP